MNIINKKVKFNYELLERYEAGLSLAGSEAKALRERGADLTNSYVKIINGEAYLVNATISIEGKKDYDASRSRKLLLHRNEIVSIQSKVKAKKLTIVPVKLYNRHRLVKIEIALAKPKREFEKRESIKRKDIEREIENEFKDSV